MLQRKPEGGFSAPRQTGWGQANSKGCSVVVVLTVFPPPRPSAPIVGSEWRSAQEKQRSEFGANYRDVERGMAPGTNELRFTGSVILSKSGLPRGPSYAPQGRG